MTDSEAFELLGIQQGSTPEEIRRAWRLQSTKHHPDVGGTNEAMVRLNVAVELALDWRPMSEDRSVDIHGRHQTTSDNSVPRMRRDVSSFTINVLPVECWMALEVVAATCGPTIQDEPPYLLEFQLHDSSLPHSRHGWCRCECVREAGATTVHLTVGSTSGVEVPSLEEVRDYLVEQLNQIDWPS